MRKKRLDVVFDERSIDMLERVTLAISEKITGDAGSERKNKSQIARAAMWIGLNELSKLSKRDDLTGDQVAGLVHNNELRAIVGLESGSK